MAASHGLTRDGRSEARIHVRILAQLRWFDGVLGVVVDNLSSRGAMLRGADLPLDGTEVVLDVAGFEIVATVAWNNPPYCGLSFHRAIDADALRERSRAGARESRRAGAVTVQ